MAVVLGRRTESDRLSRAFGRALAGGATARPLDVGGLLGLEHEFRVLVDGRPIDFGRLIHDLPIPGRRVDPADPNAYRGPWGGAITADGREAEIAIAPVESGPGCAEALVSRAGAGRAILGAALPAGAHLEGFSTHLSVAVPDALAERAARIYVRTFAPALMLLLDGPESPGLLVRPRPGRLELGGEFVDGERLRAVAAFAAGSVRVAALAARRRPFAGRGLPPAVEVDAVPALDRFGWFVGRDAVGSDLYASGRGTMLRLRRGGTVSAGEHLARCWAVARRAIQGIVSAGDLAAADRLVAGTGPLGIEGTQAEAIAFHEPGATGFAGGGGARVAGASSLGMADAFGRAIELRARPGFDVTPAIVSWDFVVLRLDGAGRTAHACLPRRLLGAGLEALDDGRLDDLLRGYLAAAERDGGRLLASNRQTGAAGLYGAVGRAADLLKSEHSPIGAPGDRPGKRRHDDQSHDQPQRPQQPADGGSAGTGSSSAARVVRTTGAWAGSGGVGLAAAGGVAGSTGSVAGTAVTGTAGVAGASAIEGSVAGGTAATTSGASIAGTAVGTAGRILGLPVGAVAAIAGVAVIAVVGGVVLAGGFGAPSATPSPPSASQAVVATAGPTPSAAPTLVVAVPSFAVPVPGTPIPVPTPDPSCQREQGLKSTSGADAKTVVFVNATSIPLQAIWLSYEGKRVFYQLVPPGQSRPQGTWVTHPWILADQNGTCLKLFVTEADTTTMQLGP